MRTVLRAAVHALERGSPVELVTVLSASGSTPRGPGGDTAELNAVRAGADGLWTAKRE